jgi:hypothetical protein
VADGGQREGDLVRLLRPGFSYRADNSIDGVLYDEEPNYRDFKNEVAERVRHHPKSYVGIADIADFYPRIYQHRLVNALQAANGSAKYEYIRVLEKMLTRFSENVSYGIPIGPAASRPLAEAILIDVDSALLSYGIDFIRFTDDFVIFTDSLEDAEYGIRVLAILSASEYLEHYLMAHDEKEEARRELMDIVGATTRLRIMRTWTNTRSEKSTR